jgi:hypothetical protein
MKPSTFLSRFVGIRSSKIFAFGFAVMALGMSHTVSATTVIVQAYRDTTFLGSTNLTVLSTDVQPVTVKQPSSVDLVLNKFKYWEFITNCTQDVLFMGSISQETAYISVDTNAVVALIKAQYEDARKNLVISLNPTNGGTIGGPDGLVVGTNKVQAGTAVTVVANEVGQFQFVKWSDSVDSPNKTVSLTVNNSIGLTANFNPLLDVTNINYQGPSALFSGSTTNVFTYPKDTNNLVLRPQSDTMSAGVGTQYRVSGWTNGAGNVAPIAFSGTPPLASTITKLTLGSSLEWLWKKQYQLTATAADANLTVSPSSPIYVDDGASYTLLATPVDQTKYELAYWLVSYNAGDPVTTYATITGLKISVTGFVNAVAVSKKVVEDEIPTWYRNQFNLLPADVYPNRPTDDPDRDDINNRDEFRASVTNVLNAVFNPFDADTDGDGMDDLYEYSNVDPTNLTAELRKTYRSAATDSSGAKGVSGNPDLDFLWSTENGYRQPGMPLSNIKEWTGPDERTPYTYLTILSSDTNVYAAVDEGGTNIAFVVTNASPSASFFFYPFTNNPTKPDFVKIRVKNFNDTSDSSFANTENSSGDSFDDGFKYSWDQWQHWGRTNVTWNGDSTNEVYLIGVTNQVPIYYTNAIPAWTPFTRVFKPNRTDTLAGGGPDNDVLYDYKTGKVSLDYYSADREYGAWQANAFSPSVGAAPHTIVMDNPPPIPSALAAAGVVTKRCSHPFLWDVEQDGLPDGYEVIFGYDPWAKVTLGHLLADGLDNPDGDWMAKSNPTNTLVLRNHEVYLMPAGFDPRVAVDQVYPIAKDMPGKGTKASPTTAKYSNREEMWGPNGIMAIVPGAENDDATNPFNYDSDGDGIWDGWENYVGLNPNLATDAPLDADGDKISNLIEFQGFYTSSTNRDALIPVADWQNKIFPTDPNGKDTDGDGIEDGAEKPLFNGTSLAASNVVIDAEGIVSTQTFALGIWNGAAYTGGGLNPTSSDTDADTLPDPYEASYAKGLDGTLGDSFNDPDGDRLKNYQEYYSCAIYHWQYDAWTYGQPSYNSADFFQGAPKAWDWSQAKYIPLFNPAKKISLMAYSGSRPTMVDSDGDNMDDFYEIYHGLNPAYGVFDLVSSRDANGDVYVGTVVADYRLYPYVAGTPEADPDGDGLPNTEEAPLWYYQQQSPRYHTDSSPLWMTDTGSGVSWVNLYYQPGSFWPWSGILPPPTYAFDFESNEGFDTDGDGRSDYEELNVTKTDPMTPERPVKRRALYLPLGQAAYARTFPGYVPGVTYPKSGYVPGTSVIGYSGDYLRSFTVEAWVRPLTPSNGMDQVVVERPIMLPSGNPMSLVQGIRLNFRLALDADGYPYASYNGNGTQLIFPEARVTGSATLSATNWTHIAATYQVPDTINPLVGGVFTLYVDGRIARQDIFRELPANGVFNPSWHIYGAPIVVGAADANPDGVIGAGSAPQPEKFFKGWIDEVRIWDGVRDSTQILAGSKIRMKQADVLASKQSPVSLFYLYSFDALTDPDHSATTTGTGVGFDPTATAIFPSGWTVSFWGASSQRSQIYSDYRMVPWIQNAAAHTPEMPVTDIGSTNGYVSLMNGTNVIGQYAAFWNSSNPYGYRYYTAPDGVLDFYDVANDLLPLRWAQADEDVPMWDNGTVPATTGFDSDGDGMPDSWEELYGLDPFDPNGVNGAYGDADHDGLANLAEYLAGSSPVSWDSKGSGFSDYDNRANAGSRTFGELYDDGDGMPGSWEALYPGPCPSTGKAGLDSAKYDADKDPDEDGWSNYAEYMGFWMKYQTFASGSNVNTGTTLVLHTSPLDPGQYPAPLIGAHVRYNGRYGETLQAAFTPGGSVISNAYHEISSTIQPVSNTGSGQLLQKNIIPGSLMFNDNNWYDHSWYSYYYDSYVSNIYDDGAGALYGEYYSSLDRRFHRIFGTIDYSSGQWTISLEGPGLGATVILFSSYDFAGGGQLKLLFYKNNAMDGWPIATLSVGSPSFVTRELTTGHLVEGKNYVFAYLDRNNDGQYDPVAEPAGISQLDLGWSDINNVEIGLTDSMQGYPRFSWPAVAGVTSYILTNSVMGIGKTIAGPRNYWHEGDWLSAGTYGAPVGPVVFIAYANNLTTYITNVVSSVTSGTLGTPSIVTPYDSYLTLVRNEIEFKVDPNATSYRMQVALSSNGTTILSVTNIAPFRDINGVSKAALPFYAGDNYVPVGGTYPSSVWANGRYWVRVQAATPVASVSSPWSAFNLDVQPPPAKSMINGDVYYFGKVSHGYGAGMTTNKLTILVQAFESPGFSGVADGQVQITTNCSNSTIGPSIVGNTNNVGIAKKGDFSLIGLMNKVYYVRAFIDVNGNRQLDSWEPVGYARVNAASTDYDLLAVDLKGEVGKLATGVRVIIRDRDTDADMLPDGWEWMYYGTLAKGSGDTGVQNMTYWGPTNMTLLRCYEVDPVDVDPTAVEGDTDGDGVCDFDEVCYSDRIAGTSPDVNRYDPYPVSATSLGTDLNPMKWDTDGDGLSDGYELDHGLNPLDPGDGAAEIARASAAGETIPGMPRVSRIAAVPPEGGQFSLTWQAQSGMNYEVQYSDDLKTWVSALGLGVSSYANGVYTYVDQSPKVTIRFYRVVVR